MRKITAIGGVPGTGKTTLMREFMAPHKWENVEPAKLCSAMYCKELDLYVLGKYELGEVFAGTDRLSMAVQPNLVAWVKTTKSNILFEGDRVFNQSFLEFLADEMDTQLNIVFLNADQALLKERYESRGSDQSEQFLRGRATKYDNLRGNFVLEEYMREFDNNTYSDQYKVLDFLNSLYQS